MTPGGNSMSPTSPVSSRHGGNNAILKRKRSTGLGGAKDEVSLASDDDENDGDNDKKRQPGVKRACNECRQQKVSRTSAFPPAVASAFQSVPIAIADFNSCYSCVATLSKIPSKAAPGATASS